MSEEEPLIVATDEPVELGRTLVNERPEVSEHWLHLGRAQAIRGMVYLTRREARPARQDMDEALRALTESKSVTSVTTPVAVVAERGDSVRVSCDPDEVVVMTGPA